MPRGVKGYQTPKEVLREQAIARSWWPVLGALIRCEGGGNRWDVEHESGVNSVFAFYTLRALVACGLASKAPYHRNWSITERGKIAYALHLGKQARAASRRSRKAA